MQNAASKSWPRGPRCNCYMSGYQRRIRSLKCLRKGNGGNGENFETRGHFVHFPTNVVSAPAITCADYNGGPILLFLSLSTTLTWGCVTSVNAIVELAAIQSQSQNVPQQTPFFRVFPHFQGLLVELGVSFYVIVLQCSSNYHFLF